MKVKISVTLPSNLLQALDRRVGGQGKRSRFIEQALRAMLEAQSRAERDAKDLKIINRRPQGLNAEAADVLTYQV